MRPIKFRAWDPKSKWIIHVDRIDFGVPKKESYCVVNCGNRYYRSEDGIILVQFTGLLDKNGKEIYEGDIFKSESWSLYLRRHKRSDETILIEVVWGSFGWSGRVIGERQGQFPLGDFYGKNDGEVIGNIYENPHVQGRR